MLMEYPVGGKKCLSTNVRYVVISTIRMLVNPETIQNQVHLLKICLTTGTALIVELG